MTLKELMNKNQALLILVLLGFSQTAFSQQYEQIEFVVKNEPRTAFIYFPNADIREPRPVIFAFHGHGGTGREAANRFKCERYWPQAVVVYPQGLKTPGQLVDVKGQHTGWQASIGDQNDRDIDFFDSLLAYLSEQNNIDRKRIYLLGHSNGGLFAFTLLAARKNTFAAIGSVSAIFSEKVKKMLDPTPVFVVTGKNDRLVKASWQEEMIEYLKKLNNCAKDAITEDQLITVYKSEIGCDLVSYLWNGGHEIPPASIPCMIDFFKKNELK